MQNAQLSTTIVFTYSDVSLEIANKPPRQPTVKNCRWRVDDDLIRQF